MLKLPQTVLLALFLATPLLGQDSPDHDSPLSSLKPVVISSAPKSDADITVPPLTMVKFVDLNRNPQPAPKNVMDLPTWLAKQQAITGLEPTGVQPWHIVIAYDQFDEDGDNFNSGTFEEFWAGPARYKRIYKSWEFNQTEFGTDKGLFRLGDQRWPKPAEQQVRSEIVDPFSYAETLQGFYARSFKQIFSGHEFQCVAVEKDSALSDPSQYCFEPGTSILRYSHGDTWLQSAFNNIFQFQGRNVARQVEVTTGGKPHLKLRIHTLEVISQLDEQDFTPPTNASGPLSDRISGVNVRTVKTTFPQFPSALRNQHFTVTLKIVIGRDGRVLSAHAISGPPKAYKASEEAVRKWLFSPYLVLGRPVEVEQTVMLSNN